MLMLWENKQGEMSPKGIKIDVRGRPLWGADTGAEPWMMWGWNEPGKHSGVECSSRGRSPCKGPEAGLGLGGCSSYSKTLEGAGSKRGSRVVEEEAAETRTAMWKALEAKSPAAVLSVEAPLEESKWTVVRFDFRFEKLSGSGWRRDCGPQWGQWNRGDQVQAIGGALPMSALYNSIPCFWGAGG